MGYEQKDNSGSIFANDKKESANHPDGKGSAMIGGIEYWVSSWNKKTQEGKPWRSIAFTPKDAKPMSKQAPKDAKPMSKQAPKKQAPQDEFEDSDVPF